MSSRYLPNQEYCALTGAEAAAEAMRQIEPGVVPVYPITPQTPIVERFAYLQAIGKVKSEIITAESEHSVMSAAIGAAAAGSRVMTATSSAGLALMYEILGVASGMRLPIVMNVASRAISAPINIHCDHSDIMGVRDAGWIQIMSESAQEVYDHNLLAVKLAEQPEVLLPTMVTQDGFVTSHMLEKLEILADPEVKKLVGDYHYPVSLLEGEKNLTLGALVLPDYFFEIKAMQFEAMETVRKIYPRIATELAQITKREYPPVETFQVDDKTEAIIVVMNSAAGTAKAVAEKLAGKGYKLGVIKIRLFRPFPYEELGSALKNVKNIAVLDRALSFGSVPPLFSEVCRTVTQREQADQKIQSYVFGLGGRDLREKDIKEVYTDLLGNKFSPETKFLNLNKKIEDR